MIDLKCEIPESVEDVIEKSTLSYENRCALKWQIHEYATHLKFSAGLVANTFLGLKNDQPHDIIPIRVVSEQGTELFLSNALPDDLFEQVQEAVAQDGIHLTKESCPEGYQAIFNQAYKSLLTNLVDQTIAQYHSLSNDSSITLQLPAVCPKGYELNSGVQIEFPDPVIHSIESLSNSVNRNMERTITVTPESQQSQAPKAMDVEQHIDSLSMER